MKKTFILSLCFCFSLLPSLALAAPAITSVSGSFNNGQSIIISGSGFGTKSPAAPTKWDNFETGTVGQTIGNGWYSFEGGGSTLPQYSTTQLRTNSAKSIVCDMVHGYTSSFGLRYGPAWEIKTVPPDPQTFYVTYWRYDDLDKLKEPTTTFNCKPMRFENISQDNLPQAFENEYNINYSQSLFGVYDDGLSIHQWHSYQLPQYQWVREEYYLYAGTQGNSDGVFTYWVNGARITGVTGGFITSTKRFNYVTIGQYCDASLLTAYIDDVYIDNTQARVELCDNGTWANRTHCEIQPPVSWSDNSITLTANQGSFTTGQTVYLYAIDSGGNVNANGYAVTLGGSPPPSPDTIPPAAPTGVTIQ